MTIRTNNVRNTELLFNLYKPFAQFDSASLNCLHERWKRSMFLATRISFDKNMLENVILLETYLTNF